MQFLNKKNIKTAGRFVFAIAVFFLPLLVVMAQTPCNPDIELCNPLKYDSFCQIIGLLLDAALIIGIPVAVLFIVYAGFKFVIARGSPNELAEARTNLFNTLIGIGIFVGASLIAKVIIGTLAQLGVDTGGSCF